MGQSCEDILQMLLPPALLNIYAVVTICDAVVALSYLFFDHFDPKIGIQYINLLPQHNLSNGVATAG